MKNKFIIIALGAVVVVGLGLWFLVPNFLLSRIPGRPAASSVPTMPGASGILTYTSPSFGVSFSYDASQASVQAQSDTIYVYSNGDAPTSGQSIQKFDKLPNETLAQSIQRQILAGNATSTCKIIAGDHPDTPKEYQTVEISYPRTNSDPNGPWFANAALCNSNYDQTNGVRYFLYDPNHVDRFYFVNIGQYGIMADAKTPWQDTIKIIANVMPTVNASSNATTTSTITPTLSWSNGMAIVTQANNHQTVHLKINDRLGLQFGNTLDWTFSFAPKGIISSLPNAVAINGLQGVYQANANGTTTLTATGRPICKPGQMCAQFILEVNVNFVVQ